MGSNIQFDEVVVATQTPGARLTIISGSLRGRKCIHLADVFARPVDSPTPGHGFRVQLLTDEGREAEFVVVACHQVKVGW